MICIIGEKTTNFTLLNLINILCWGRFQYIRTNIFSTISTYAKKTINIIEGWDYPHSFEFIFNLSKLFCV